MFREDSLKKGSKIEKKKSTPKGGENEGDRTLAETVKFYHDQKNNDFNPETGEIYRYGARNIENTIFNENARREKEVGSQERLKQQIVALVATLDSLELEDNFKKDRSQITLLEEKKKIAKKLILDILRQVTRYVDDVRSTEKLFAREKNDDDQGDRLSRDLAEASQLRRSSHEQLLEKIFIAKRFIENNFGQIDDEEQGKEWGEKEKKAGREIAHVKRVRFNSNVVCPPALDIKDREQVAAWAFQIYEALSELEDGLEKKEEGT